MSTGAERLIDLQREKAARVSSRHLRGVPVNNIDGDFKISKMSHPFPIQWCLCVTEEGCPCADLVVWLPSPPKLVRKTGTKSADGRDIYDFVLAPDAEVILNVPMRVPLGTLTRVAGRAQRVRDGQTVVVRPRPTRGDGPPPLIEKGKAPDLGWLGLAGRIGWGVGSVFDDLLGSNEGGNDNLSDDLSGWFADNLPAPEWLKDIFD